MEGTLHIIKRFIGATIVISISLLVLNFALLPFWINSAINKGPSPAYVVQQVAKGLQRTESAYSLEPDSRKLLDQSQSWAMLIDANGQVSWSYHLPKEIPLQYSLTDVSKFALNYLKDYPVFVWEHSDGLVVVGYPKGSLAKYQHIVPTHWVKNLPLQALYILAGNIVLVLLISLGVGLVLIRSIRPLTQGIQALAEDKEIQLETKGILSNLAYSINQTSSLLRSKNESLKSRDVARANWIAGISHDIRTPLSMVLGYASELEENEALPQEQRRQAGMIRFQAEKLRSLISDLNLVSLLEYEMQPLSPKPLRLAALTRQAATEILNNGLEPCFTLDINPLDESAQVNADERLLFRAMTNLIHNSMKHNPSGCEIWLSVTLDAEHHSCSFIVADNGKGIPRGELSDVLELPYSSKTKRNSSHEHGLGLPMAAKIAEAHHGQLILTSDTGEGLTAEIKLPLLSESTRGS